METLTTKDQSNAMRQAKPRDNLTRMEREALDLMKPDTWYCPDGFYGESLPYTIRRRAHVLDSLKKKGAVEWKVHLAIPGNYHSTYSVYRRLSHSEQSNTAQP